MPKSRRLTGRLAFTLAGPSNAPALAALRGAAARELTRQYGEGHWSSEPSERGVVADLRHAEVWIARRGAAAVGTFRLATKKPWAIDRSYFTDCKRPIYLTNMAVRPDYQRRGIGRSCLEHAIRRVREWPRMDCRDRRCIPQLPPDARARALVLAGLLRMLLGGLVGFFAGMWIVFNSDFSLRILAPFLLPVLGACENHFRGGFGHCDQCNNKIMLIGLQLNI